MLEYVSACGFVKAQACLNHSHIVTASALANVVLSPPVKLG